jgi:hypothetical protein
MLCKTMVHDFFCLMWLLLRINEGLSIRIDSECFYCMNSLDALPYNSPCGRIPIRTLRMHKRTNRSISRLIRSTIKSQSTNRDCGGPKRQARVLQTWLRQWTVNGIFEYFINSKWGRWVLISPTAMRRGNSGNRLQTFLRFLFAKLCGKKLSVRVASPVIGSVPFCQVVLKSIEMVRLGWKNALRATKDSANGKCGIRAN